MSDDPNIRALAGLVRERERDEASEDEALLAYARGERDARASATEGSLDDAVHPFDDAALDRLTAAALAARDDEGRANVVELAKVRARRAPWIAGIAAALAIAAGVALVVRGSSEGTSPRYALVVTGGDVEKRGDDAGPAPTRVVLSPGAYVKIDLRPERTVEREFGAAAFLVRDGEARPVAGTIARAESGAMRIEGSREALFADASGAWELVVFVGPPVALPRDGEQARKARAANDPRVQVLATPIELPR